MAHSIPASSTSPTPHADTLTAPTLRRRLAAMLYEGLLLLGVLFGATAILLALRENPAPLGAQAWGFLALGCYFVGFWRQRGQTLAMQTWRIRVVSASGAPVSLRQAIARYLLAWIWVAAAAVIIHAGNLTRWVSAGTILACLLTWAALCWLDPQRQFLHDRLAGTRLVYDRPPVPASRCGAPILPTSA